MSGLEGSLDEVAGLPEGDRAARLVHLGKEVVGSSAAATEAGKWIGLVLPVIDSELGSGRERLALGELLGMLGDPRIKHADDPDYWVRIPSDSGQVTIGRFPVTNAEYRAWADGGGYDDESAWSPEGLAWRDACEDAWPIRAQAEGSEPFVVANQPVVGVTWFEAEAFARAHGARLPRADERVWVTRGRERRPYPWGSPFGEGNANTREEVLGRPCAVGLYPRDRTPEGVYDLAGNAAEWTADAVGSGRLIHPGAWDQPSMAAWAKALSIESPDSRWAGLGFRLARD